MNENDNNIYFIDKTLKYQLKTEPVKDSEGNIIKHAFYLDSDVSMNEANTKDQLEKIATEIDEAIKSVPYDTLIDVAIYNSSDDVSEQAKKEIKRRIVSGELKNNFAIGHEKVPELAAFLVLDILDKIRSKYLQSVDENKGHTR